MLILSYKKHLQGDFMVNCEEIIYKIAQCISKKGGKSFYVGGYVRDNILNHVSEDIDIEVHGLSAECLMDVLSQFGEVYTKGSFFGVFAIKGYPIDFALPRKEKAYGNKHRDFEIYLDPNLSVEESARRRDFTINSIYKDVLTGEIIDPFHGLQDIKDSIIRHIDDKSFIEDPLRVFRSAQFSSRLNFKISDKTKDLCRTMDLRTISKERVDLELKKALIQSNKPSMFFDNLIDMDAVDIWFPEIKRLKEIPQNPIYHPEGNVYNHTMMVLDEAAKRKNESSNEYFFMLSALCHDFGKILTTKTNEDGVIHAYNHESEGLSLCKHFILRFSNDKKRMAYVLNMVLHHMEPNKCAAAHSTVKKTNHMFDNSINAKDLLLLAECDALSSADKNSYSVKKEFLTSRLIQYYKILKEPDITGKDLILYGIKPGKTMGDALEYAHKLKLAGIEKETAIKQVLSYAKNAQKKSFP